MGATADRARDLLAALEDLVRQRNSEPDAYRAVHAAATRAVGALHEELLDSRTGGDVDAAVAEHAELVRRLRGMPRPTTGQRPPRPIGVGRPPGVDALRRLLEQAGARTPQVDALFGDLFGDVASGLIPQVERAVREGLDDLFGLLGRDVAGGDAAGAGAPAGDRSEGAPADGDEVWDEAPDEGDPASPDEGAAGPT